MVERRLDRFQLSSERASVLLTGMDTFHLYRSAEKMKADWLAHRDELMKLCAEKNGPGHRPFGWWRFEHPELFRRQIGGTGTPAYDAEDAPAWAMENHFGHPRGVE